LRFGTFLVLLLKEFFYAIPLVGTFILKVYTLGIFVLIFKNYFSNFKVLLKKKHGYYETTTNSVDVYCIHPGINLWKLQNELPWSGHDTYDDVHLVLNTIYIFQWAPEILVVRLASKSNNLPRMSYEARRLVLKLRLKHEAIKCCPNWHVLFRGEFFFWFTVPI